MKFKYNILIILFFPIAADRPSPITEFVGHELLLTCDDYLGVKLVYLDKVSNFGNGSLSILKDYDLSRNIYLVNVLEQDIDNTCGRHSIKNLIYFIGALEQDSIEGFKSYLRLLFNKEAFYVLNRDLCNYLNIFDIYKEVTYPHKIFNVFSSFEIFMARYVEVAPFLDMNIESIISKICPIPMSLDENNISLINDFTNLLFSDYGNELLCSIEREKLKHLEVKNFYKNYIPSENCSLSNIVPYDAFRRTIYSFKASEQPILGLTLLIPGGSLGHWIGVVIRKVKGKTFEIFVLDSAHNSINYDGLRNTLDVLLAELA